MRKFGNIHKNTFQIVFKIQNKRRNFVLLLSLLFFEIEVCSGYFSMSGGATEVAVYSSDRGGINENNASVEAPVVPFGVDLYYWGEEQPTAGKIIKYSLIHKKH